MANTKTYDKLVRDRIPEIIEKSGKSCAFRLLSDAEYIRLLDEKLQEELNEYRESGETEELAGGLLFLLDDKAAGFITGVVLPIDGGFSAYSGV